MSDFIIKKSDFTTTQNSIFRATIGDAKLTPEAWGVYVFMLSLPPDWDYTIMGLTKVVNAGKNKIQRILKELETAGFIKRHQENKGVFGKMKYELLDFPEPPTTDVLEPEIIEVENTFNPYPQNPLADNPYPQNQPQLNTNILNTNKQSNNREIDTSNMLDNTPQIDNSISLSLVEKLGLDLGINKTVSDKFYHYFKARDFKTKDNIKITKRNVKNLLIYWNSNENQNTIVVNTSEPKVNKPKWLDEYMKEIQEMEG